MTQQHQERPLICGAGIAGLAGAFILAKYKGQKPIILEKRLEKTAFNRKNKIVFGYDAAQVLGKIFGLDNFGIRLTKAGYAKNFKLDVPNPTLFGKLCGQVIEYSYNVSKFLFRTLGLEGLLPDYAKFINTRLFNIYDKPDADAEDALGFLHHVQEKDFVLPIFEVQKFLYDIAKKHGCEIKFDSQIELLLKEGDGYVAFTNQFEEISYTDLIIADGANSPTTQKLLEGVGISIHLQNKFSPANNAYAYSTFKIDAPDAKPSTTGIDKEFAKYCYHKAKDFGWAHNFIPLIYVLVRDNEAYITGEIPEIIQGDTKVIHEYLHSMLEYSNKGSHEILSFGEFTQPKDAIVQDTIEVSFYNQFPKKVKVIGDAALPGDFLLGIGIRNALLYSTILAPESYTSRTKIDGIEIYKQYLIQYHKMSSARLGISLDILKAMYPEKEFPNLKEILQETTILDAHSQFETTIEHIIGKTSDNPILGDFPLVLDAD